MVNKMDGRTLEQYLALFDDAITPERDEWADANSTDEVCRYSLLGEPFIDSLLAEKRLTF